LPANIDGLIDARAAVGAEVAERDTAASLGSGDLSVLGTPRALALCEQACCNLVAPALDSSRTSVGVSASFEHVRAAAIGCAIVAEAVLVGIDGSKLEFNVTIHAGSEAIFQGMLIRRVVDKARLLSSALR
jgi:fluoroacetyl-CoA thioesterase